MAKQPEQTADPKPNVDWINERLEALKLTKVEASKALLFSHPNTFHKLLSGERRTQIDECLLLAKLLNVPPAIMARQLGYDWPIPQARIIGEVDGAGRVRVLPPGKQSDVDAPSELEVELVALQVAAAQTALSVYDGNILYYEPSEVVRPDAFGRLAVLEIGDQPAPVVGVLDRASLGRGRVVVFGGIETIETNKIISATPIRWQRAC